MRLGPASRCSNRARSTGSRIATAGARAAQPKGIAAVVVRRAIPMDRAVVLAPPRRRAGLVALAASPRASRG